MYKNKALIDRILNTPSVNDNNVMMYRKLVSLIEEYNRIARDKGLPIKSAPVYNDSVNCTLMSKLLGNILKDLGRIEAIKEEDTDGEKILRNVTFVDDQFTNDIWDYEIIYDEDGNDTNIVSVSHNADAFSRQFDGDIVTLGYDKMPYEKLITSNGTEYLTTKYYMMFNVLPSYVTTLTIDNWTNRNVTDMGSMFQGCSSLTSLTLGTSFDTSKVESMSSMFYRCKKLKALDLSSWTVKYDATTVDMFTDCDALVIIKLSKTGARLLPMLPAINSDTWYVVYNNTEVEITGQIWDSVWGAGPMVFLRHFTDGDKILSGVSFDGNTFEDSIWTYTKDSENNVSVKLNANNEFTELITESAVTLGNDEMPYEILIDTNGNVYIVNSYEDMFSELSDDVISLTIDGWTNRNVTDMDNMFASRRSLTSLTLGNNFDTSNVTNMFGMFDGCSLLESLTLGNNFDTSKVTDMNNMFSGCDDLVTLKLYKPTELVLERLPLGTWNVNDTDDTVVTYGNDTEPIWNPPELPNSWDDTQWTFTRTDKIMRDVIFESNTFTDGNWVYTLQGDGNVSVKLKQAVADYPETLTFDYDDMPYEKLIDTLKTEHPITSYNNIFANLVSIIMDNAAANICNWTNRNVTHMSGLFKYSRYFKSISFNNFDTSNVTNMNNMFYRQTELESLTLGDKFDTSKVSDMSYMFDGCSKLTSLDLGDKFDTSNVENMSYMFYNCRMLTSLTLGDKFDTSKVSDMSYMFNGCSSLTALTLGENFNTFNVTKMSGMFSGCDNLKSVTLYQSAESIIKMLPGGTWKIDSTDNTITVTQGSSAEWSAPQPSDWATVPITLKYQSSQ